MSIQTFRSLSSFGGAREGFVWCVFFNLLTPALHDWGQWFGLESIWSVYSTPQSRFSDSITAISHSHRRFIPLPKVDFRTPSPPSSHLRHRLQGRDEGVDLPVVEINNSLMLHVVVGAGPFPSLLSPKIFSSSFRAKAIALSPKMHWISNIVVGLYFLSVVTKFGIRKVYMGYFTSYVVILKIIMFMICYHIGYRTQFHEAPIHLFSSPILLISPDLHLIKQSLYGSSRNVDEATKRLVEVTEQCLERGISVCKDVSPLMTRVRCYYNRFRHMGNNRYCSMPNLQLRIRTYGI
ncbi:unnamed protein product [Lactuca virosa]|uniref:Reticulon domain-containing protein n=1 Tax=Lactuca virosa TaxID=75947 RepID=A0AAU9PH75_9ASTR|nr:unnamed protein product [Lactuca virosa]